MTTVSSKVPFYQLCVILEKIQKRQGNANKKTILKEFIEEWRKFHGQLHASNKNTTDSFYPAMRLLLPHLERERDAYGIKEVMLAKLYIDILGLGKTSPSAQKLLNYRAPKSAKADAGDFAMVAFTVLQTRCPEKGTLTIEQVNTHLDQVSLCNANKDRAGVKKSLEHMLRSMSAKEQKWLIRMIMKELKMGLSQQSIFSVFHDDAEDLFNVKMSLQKVCEMLRDPGVRLHEVEISVFSPFRPMLGDRGQPQKIEKLMNNKEYIIETKFDGERMQLHKKGEEYKYYSRSGNEYTHVFGGEQWSGTFTPHISNCFKPHVTSCILDGEMVGFDPVRETIGTKGQQFDIKSMDTREYQPMLCVFDVLLVNDKVLSNKPLTERKQALKDVFNPIPGRIVLSKIATGKTKEDCIDALNEAIDGREEGIMVKDPDSVYKPNVRKGGWFKIKPDYMSGVMDELDVVVVGGYFGAGHRSNLLSHFLCAVAVPPSEGEHPTQFKTFCKVGSGYTRTELYDFNQKLKEHWQRCSKKQPPAWLTFASGFRQRPDLLIEPKNSCILQIRAAEITPSDQFATDCTLRFPRVEKIRDDKAWSDCMTTEELDDLRQKASGKLATRLLNLDEDEEAPKSKRRRTAAAARHVKPTVMSRFVGVDTSDLKQVGELFAEQEICVLNGPPGHSKAELEKRIVEYGGSIVQNPGAETHCVLADKVSLKVNNLMKKGVYDVVRPAWLLRCVECRRLLPWVPADMIHASPKTTAMFGQEFDSHGDSYYDDTNVEALKNVFSQIEKQEKMESVTSDFIAELEMHYFPHDSPLGLFRTCSVYVDDCAEVNDEDTRLPDHVLQLPALDLRYHGATLVPHITPAVTHVLVSTIDTSRLHTLKIENKARSRKFHLVSEKWVEECIEKQKLLTERYYEPSA